ncbi:MAG: M23 family metallopeptidase [Treponema sp.]|nr:M23 family metallopeptidase [Treponema sp.]MCL2272269.1 M23 family metallopeptidase [Treponema sp.]
MPDRGNIGRIILGFVPTFFLAFLVLPVCEAQEAGGAVFPVISRLDMRDTGFKQYFSDVESNRRLLVRFPSGIRQAAENMIIFQYTVRQGDDLLSMAARCNIPYSALASLNRLTTSSSITPGTVVLLPSCPGLFIPSNPNSELEKLTGSSRFSGEWFVDLNISISGKNEVFHFFPGADYTPTERAFFLNAGFFRFPLRDYRVTSSFGVRANPVTGNISMHQGVDLAAPDGTEVFSAADGVVLAIGDDPIYGIYVIIRHQNNWTSLYGHLQKTETTLQAEVKSGTLIGRVGSTGQSTGPHLHFELRQDGRAIDPSGRLRH